MVSFIRWCVVEASGFVSRWRGWGEKTAATSVRRCVWMRSRRRSGVVWLWRKWTLQKEISSRIDGCRGVFWTTSVGVSPQDSKRSNSMWFVLFALSWKKQIWATYEQIWATCTSSLNLALLYVQVNILSPRNYIYIQLICNSIRAADALEWGTVVY